MNEDSREHRFVQLVESRVSILSSATYHTATTSTTLASKNQSAPLAPLAGKLPTFLGVARRRTPKLDECDPELRGLSTCAETCVTDYFALVELQWCTPIHAAFVAFGTVFKVIPPGWWASLLFVPVRAM